MRALLVAAPAGAERIRALLALAEISFEVADRLDEAVELALGFSFDAIVVGPAGMTGGSELVRRLRAARVRQPVLLITAAASSAEVARALDLGADDHLIMPPDPRVLAARLRALVRRVDGHTSSVIRIGKLEIDLGRRWVEVDGKALVLRGKMFEALDLLVRRVGKVVSKATLLDQLYGLEDDSPAMRSVDKVVERLRSRIADMTGGEHYIHCVYGEGYILDERTT